MNDTVTEDRWQNGKAIAVALIPLIAFLAALWFLEQEFRNLSMAQVVESLRTIPTLAIVAALLLTALNYVVLIGYDWLGIRCIDHPISRKQIVTASLFSYAFSNSLGALFGGTPIRWRMYSAWGLTAPEIVRLIYFIGSAFWTGLFLLAGLVFIFSPFDIPQRLHFPLASSEPLGYILLILVSIYWSICFFRRKEIEFFGVNFQPPPFRIAIVQALIAAFDFGLTAATLYVLLPADISIGYFQFTAIFLLALFVALVSHVPGGLGVLEVVLLVMLPQTSESIVASLLIFRIVYYLLPLLIAMICLAAVTVYKHHHRVTGLVAATASLTTIIAPRFITGGVYLAGIVLLVSGSLPAAQGRMEIVRDLLPLTVIELSHFLASFVGALLIVLGRGLQQRIDAAWRISCGLLAFGAIFSLAKGFDYEEAIVMLLLLVILLPCREHFYRRGGLLAARADVGWIVTIGMSIGLLVWLIFFAYRNVQYSDEMWWQFAYEGDAPRSLRALVGVSVVLCVVGVARIIRAHPVPPELGTPDQIAAAAKIVAQSPRTQANLALLGDKRFIFSQDKQAFVMFGCEGRSWVSMGDPVGNIASADDAAWRFREACDEAGVKPAFYQVDESRLGRYIEMGLSILKLGEEAKVTLPGFSLEGSARKNLRRTMKRADEMGLSFKVVPAAEHSPTDKQGNWIDPSTPEFFQTLQRISDAWMNEKSTGEKGFSLGNFNIDYLRRYDIGLVMLKDEPIGFTNIWRGADRQELSVDLMRYLPDAPYGVMEYLFTKLMMWGSEEGYQTFSLGMAPLAGVDSHRLGPLWNRVSSLVYRHGEHFYNFQGLRSYKAKFDPVWHPKYLAAPGGFASPQVLANVSTLIAGGMVKLLRR